MTDRAMTISVAEEANASPAGANKACSDGGSRKDKCGDGKRTGARNRGDPQKRPLCHGGRNCYACGGFGHMARHCRNRGRIAEERRVEFEGNHEHSNALKGEENLESLD